MIDYLKTLFGIYPEFGSVARSPHWSAVRGAYIKANPLCAACEIKGGLLKPNEVHHKRPYHLHPELELDPTNFITFCRVHHLLFGHLMAWPSFNEAVVEDAALWNAKIKARPVGNVVDVSN